MPQSRESTLPLDPEARPHAVSRADRSLIGWSGGIIIQAMPLAFRRTNDSMTEATGPFLEGDSTDHFRELFRVLQGDAA